MISEQDVQTYKRDGVIVVPEVLGKDTLAQVRSVISELVAGSAKTLEHTDVYDLEPGHTAESPRVRRIKAPHKVDGLFDRIVRSAPVVEILKKLIGPRLRLHGSKLNMSRRNTARRWNGIRTGRSIRTPMTTCSRSASCSTIATSATDRCW